MAAAAAAARSTNSNRAQRQESKQYTGKRMRGMRWARRGVVDAVLLFHPFSFPPFSSLLSLHSLLSISYYSYSSFISLHFNGPIFLAWAILAFSSSSTSSSSVSHRLFSSQCIRLRSPSNALFLSVITAGRFPILVLPYCLHVCGSKVAWEYVKVYLTRIDIHIYVYYICIHYGDYDLVQNFYLQHARGIYSSRAPRTSADVYTLFLSLSLSTSRRNLSICMFRLQTNSWELYKY